MRVRGKDAVVMVVALTATGVSGIGTGAVSAASATSAAGAAGRVCMFDAPHGVFGLGHVAWAYRSADHSGNWDYGATLSDHNWHKHGSEQQILHDFATSDESGGYRGYRCADTAADDERAAGAAMAAAFARHYQLATDNCLTRSIEIFKAYDRSGGLNGLEKGRFTFPNAYFNYELTGWSAETKF